MMNASTEERKYMIFATLSMISAMIELPQIIGSCFNFGGVGNMESEMALLTSSLSDSILDLIKTVVYLDTAFNLLFK